MSPDQRSEGSMDENEQYVRSKWEQVEARWLPSMPDRFRVEMVYDSAMVWVERPHPQIPSEKPFVRKQTEQQAWSAARAFTEEREKQIAKIAQEIRWLMNRLDVEAEDAGIVTSIIAREQAEVNELKRGVKGLKA
jgi:hypothetical protein